MRDQNPTAARRTFPEVSSRLCARILEAQQAQIAARLEAVKAVETALDRLHQVFGMPPESAQEEPQGRAMAVSGLTVPPDHASPVLEPPAATASASALCEECAEPFEPRRSGQPNRFCSRKCRQRAHLRRRQQRREELFAAGQAEVVDLASLPDRVERPLEVRIADASPSELLRPPPVRLSSGEIIG
jgi:hypothetical protein